MAVPHNGGVPGSIPPGDGVVDDLTAATLTVTGASTLATMTATTATITTLNTTLAGELGGTPAAATVDALHGGSTHAATQASAEATAAAALTAHEADTTAVHGIADTTVLATDAEVTAAVAAHTGDSSAAHAASAVSFTPAGTIAGTDVQAAVVEVATDAAADLSTHAAAADPHAGYLLESAHNAALRFVPIARATVFSGATTAVTIARTLTAAIASLPSDAVLASGYMEVASDVFNVSNYIAVYHTEAGTNDVASITRNQVVNVGNYAPFTAGVVQSTGSKLSYTVNRAAGTITYSLFVTGYWTAAAA